MLQKSQTQKHINKNQKAIFGIFVLILSTLTNKVNAQEKDDFSRLPKPVLIEVFKYLDIENLVNVSEVSKKFKSASDHPDCWKNRMPPATTKQEVASLVILRKNFEEWKNVTPEELKAFTYLSTLMPVTPLPVKGKWIDFVKSKTNAIEYFQSYLGVERPATEQIIAKLYLQKLGILFPSMDKIKNTWEYIEQFRHMDKIKNTGDYIEQFPHMSGFIKSWQIWKYEKYNLNIWKIAYDFSNTIKFYTYKQPLENSVGCNVVRFGYKSEKTIEKLTDMLIFSALKHRNKDITIKNSTSLKTDLRNQVRKDLKEIKVPNPSEDQIYAAMYMRENLKMSSFTKELLNDIILAQSHGFYEPSMPLIQIFRDVVATTPKKEIKSVVHQKMYNYAKNLLALKNKALLALNVLNIQSPTQDEIRKTRYILEDLKLSSITKEQLDKISFAERLGFPRPSLKILQAINSYEKKHGKRPARKSDIINEMKKNEVTKKELKK